MKERRIRILTDDNPQSPLDFDNLGTIACWNSRYALGNEQPATDPEEWIAGLCRGIGKNNIVALPLYLYEHSGITITAGPSSLEWDRGQLGWIYTTTERAERFGFAWDRERIVKTLQFEITIYDEFVRGNVYGYQIEEREADPCDKCGRVADWERIDSCWGFIGTDPDTNGMSDYLSAADLEALRECDPDGRWITVHGVPS